MKASVILALICALISPVLAHDDPYPPYVLVGSGKLVCNISSRKSGIQRLTIENGSGASFDITVTPIIDGVITLKKKKKRRLNYRFTSNLLKAKRFAVTGFGPVRLVDLKTRVSVSANRYQQPKGPGTKVSFTSQDMDRKGVYVEFMGIFEQTDTRKRFSFRTLMGPPTTGKGEIQPYDSNDSSAIVAKTVMVEVQPMPSRPFTQIVTTIRELSANQK